MNKPRTSLANQALTEIVIQFLTLKTDLTAKQLKPLKIHHKS